jgi:hypothetical protein
MPYVLGQYLDPALWASLPEGFRDQFPDASPWTQPLNDHPIQLDEPGRPSSEEASSDPSARSYRL